VRLAGSPCPPPLRTRRAAPRLLRQTSLALVPTGSGLQKQAGQKLDRFGLLTLREASKPRTAEQKLVIQNNPLQNKTCAPRSEAARAREVFSYTVNVRNRPKRTRSPRRRSRAGLPNALPTGLTTRLSAATNSLGNTRNSRPPGPLQGKRPLCPLFRLRRKSQTTRPQLQRTRTGGLGPRTE
jgi:hypothetical protein